MNSRGELSLQACKEQSNSTILPVVFVLVTILIVTGFAVFSIQTDRPSLQLSNSAQQFAEHIERARADSIRRRAESGEEASVQVLNATTYRLKMGFGGSNTLTTRDFTLEGDTVFTTYPRTVSFDSRGRPTTGTATTFAFRSSSGSSTNVDVNVSGDVSAANEIFGHANVVGDVSPLPRSVSTTGSNLTINANSNTPGALTATVALPFPNKPVSGAVTD